MPSCSPRHSGVMSSRTNESYIIRILVTSRTRFDRHHDREAIGYDDAVETVQVASVADVADDDEYDEGVSIAL